MLNRRSVLKAGAATLTVAAPAAPAAATLAAPTKDPVLDLVRQYAKTLENARRVGSVADGIMNALPRDATLWTPAELIEHRIPGDKSQPRLVWPDDINKADAADRPRDTRSTREESTVQTDEGELFTQFFSMLTFPMPENERLAWKERCAARMALGKAKADAWAALLESSGYNAAVKRTEEAYREHGRVLDLLFSTPATTPAGVAAKMRVVMTEQWGPDGPDDDKIEHHDQLFMRALADLERIGGAA